MIDGTEHGLVGAKCDGGSGAVVAKEVKELAKQTAAATEGVGRKIEAIPADAKGP